MSIFVVVKIITLYPGDVHKSLNSIGKSYVDPPVCHSGYHAVKHFTYMLLHVFSLLKLIGLPLCFIREPLPAARP